MVRRIKRQEASTGESIGGTREKNERSDQELKSRSNEDRYTMKSSGHTVSARVRNAFSLQTEPTERRTNSTRKRLTIHSWWVCTRLKKASRVGQGVAKGGRHHFSRAVCESRNMPASSQLVARHEKGERRMADGRTQEAAVNLCGS